MNGNINASGTKNINIGTGKSTVNSQQSSGGTNIPQIIGPKSSKSPVTSGANYSKYATNKQQKVNSANKPTGAVNKHNGLARARSRMKGLEHSLKHQANSSFSNKQVFDSVFQVLETETLLSYFPNVTGFSLRDEIKASIIIKEREGGKPKLGGRSSVIQRFLIRAVAGAHEEKAQIMETFGQPIIYFFGEKPIVLNFVGAVYDTENMPWFSDFLDRYEQDLRGTRLNFNNQSIFILLDNHVIEGYILKISYNKGAHMTGHADMQFSFVVVKWGRYRTNEHNQGNTFEEQFKTFNDIYIESQSFQGPTGA